MPIPIFFPPPGFVYGFFYRINTSKKYASVFQNGKVVRCESSILAVNKILSANIEPLVNWKYLFNKCFSIAIHSAI